MGSMEIYYLLCHLFGPLCNGDTFAQHKTTEEVEDVEQAFVKIEVTEKENVSASKSDERSLHITDIDDEICNDRMLLLEQVQLLTPYWTGHLFISMGEAWRTSS